MEDIEQHLRNVHSDPSREVPLGDCSRLEPEDPPETPLDTKEPSLSEVQHVVKKARTGSAPGPNGIPYRVYKMCPGILRKLWSLLRVIWRKGKIPDCWKRAEGIFAPKEEGLEEYWSVPDHFSAQRRGEDILCSPSQATDNVPYRQQLR